MALGEIRSKCEHIAGVPLDAETADQLYRLYLTRGVQATTADVDLVKRFNRLVLTGLPIEENVVPGELRTFSVGVGSYRGAPAEDCGYLLERLCSFLNAARDQSAGLDRLSVSVLLAILAHLYLAWIHPFGGGGQGEDGNNPRVPSSQAGDRCAFEEVIRQYKKGQAKPGKEKAAYPSTGGLSG